jgi:hypothetical protein
LGESHATTADTQHSNAGAARQTSAGAVPLHSAVWQPNMSQQTMYRQIVRQQGPDACVMHESVCVCWAQHGLWSRSCWSRRCLKTPRAETNTAYTQVQAATMPCPFIPHNSPVAEASMGHQPMCGLSTPRQAAVAACSCCCCRYCRGGLPPWRGGRRRRHAGYEAAQQD